MLLYIIAFILLILTALLAARIRVIITYDDGFSVTIKYIFLSMRMKPGEKDKTRKKIKKKPAAPQGKKQDIKKFIRSFQKIAEYSKKAVGDTLRNIRIDKLFIQLIIDEEDAARTAILFGEACATVYPAVGLICGKFEVKNRSIEIKPEFNGGESKIEFECILSRRLGSMIRIAFLQTLFFVWRMARENASTRQKKGVVK